MNGSVVVVNAGSSSLKLAAWPAATVAARDWGEHGSERSPRPSPRSATGWCMAGPRAPRRRSSMKH
jgi:hypothetical protein